jgi:hypothetical protein
MSLALNSTNGDSKNYTGWMAEYEARRMPTWRQHEAPVTYTAKWRDESGLEQFICLRGDSLSELLPVITTITSQARSKHRQQDPVADLQPTTTHAGEERPDWCKVHRCVMPQQQKDGRSWYSHKTAEGWCKGKGK